MLKFISYCKNCGVRYNYQASGFGASEYNDSEYCPECQKLIVDALSKVEKKTELRYVGCNYYTMEEILGFENLEDKKYENSFFPRMIQVYPHSVNLNDKNDPINFESTKALKINKTEYIYTYNRKTNNLVRLRKEVRWNLLNNKEEK